MVESDRGPKFDELPGSGLHVARRGVNDQHRDDQPSSSLCNRNSLSGDDLLIDAIAQGSTSAFDELYSRSAPALARFAWSVSASRETAEELTQETFLTAWHRHGSIRLVLGLALPWLLSTCRNHSRNYARRDQRQREVLAAYDASVASDPINGVAAAQLRVALDAIGNLPDIDRRVRELCLLQGYSYREAAEQFAISEASVGKRLHRARQRIRREAH